jgi:SAM-dependent methyltransferase
MAHDPPRARYDGLADWYDETARRWAERAPGQRSDRAARDSHVIDHLGVGTGSCLDLACGPSWGAAAIRASGRHPIGLDLSIDQLRVGAARADGLVLADAACLPFPDACFPTVVALWMTTDVDDLKTVLNEVARVLIPGGHLLLWGAHPCFNAPAIERFEDGSVRVHTSYRTRGRTESSPFWGDGVRRRVGMNHHTLSDLFDAVLDAGLTIHRVSEPDPHIIPISLAIVTTRPATRPPERT